MAGAEIGVGGEVFIFLAYRRRVAITPKQNVMREVGEFRPDAGVDKIAGAGDREVVIKLPIRRLRHDPARLFSRR